MQGSKRQPNLHILSSVVPYTVHSTSGSMQLEELNLENSRLVNPELERLQGVVDGLKGEVSQIIYFVRQKDGQKAYMCCDFDGA